MDQELPNFYSGAMCFKSQSAMVAYKGIGVVSALW
jgi:hypothetical protein